MPPKRDDASPKMSRRQLFARLVPPGVKELAEKANPDLQKKKADAQAQQEAEATAKAQEMERRVAMARDGNVALAAGNLAEAVAHFREFAKAYPKEAMPRLCLGRALYDMGQIIQARVEFQRALALTQDGPAHLQDHATLFLGLCLLRLKKYWKTYELWNAWHPQGVPALAAALDGVLPGIRELAMDPEQDSALPLELPADPAALAAAGADLASPSSQAPACAATVAVETAVAKTPWAHLPPMVPTLPVMQA